MNREIKFRAFHNNEEMVYFGLGNSVPDGEIMQFTGLLDKNGTEIYEGDILEVVYYNYSMKDTKLIQEVYYSSEDGCFCVKTIGKDVFPITEYRNNVALHYTHQPNTLKVIGNIHENTELL